MEEEKKKRKIHTCVTSAEMTQMSTTATIRHSPARYLRPEPMSAGGE